MPSDIYEQMKRLEATNQRLRARVIQAKATSDVAQKLCEVLERESRQENSRWFETLPQVSTELGSTFMGAVTRMRVAYREYLTDELRKCVAELQENDSEQV